jgi:hypothetical protein
MHRFIILSEDIYTLDNAAQRREAREAMRDAGIESLPIFEGEPGEGGEETGETLAAAAAVPAAPSAEDVAGYLGTLIDPESDDDMRAEVIERLATAGRASVRTYRERMILTDDEGFVLTVGGAEYQVTVQQVR